MKFQPTERQKDLAAVVVLVLIVLAVFLWPSKRQSPKKAAQAPSQSSNVARPASVAYSVKPIAGGLFVPWSIVFPSKDRFLVSERSGAIRIIRSGHLQSHPLVTFGVSDQSEEGLMGLALDPDYSVNKLLYACYAYSRGGSLIDRVVRFVDHGSSAGPQHIVIDGIPAALNHAGCRLGFGPKDHKLYVTTGDATNRSNPQNLGSLGGKILRVNGNGSIPSDNPFAHSPVWTLGHRNPQGIAWQPGTNQLYETEHGPTAGVDGAPGGDEVNIIIKGHNYGWPIVSHNETDKRFVTPLLVFTPAIAPSGATFYTSDVLPQFKNNLLFAALKGSGVYRVIFDTKNRAKIIVDKKIPDINVGRVRDVEQGPDGALYILTSNRDGRGTVRRGDDHVYRIAPR